MNDDVTNVQLTRTMNDMHRNIDILLEYDVCIDIDKIFVSNVPIALLAW